MAVNGSLNGIAHGPGEIHNENHGDPSHQIISAHFIGPQSENLDAFKENVLTILDELRKARARYYPEDPSFIPKKVRESDAFQQQMSKLRVAVQKTAEIMGKTSIPFWSPRYEAHMCTDMSMASLLGYFMTMIYNPNNVALEASPFSTVAEIEVGEQLCELFGYNIDENDTDNPTGWGHVTCDGTVANLESVWVSRNAKFYPLSIWKAMQKGNPLEFLASKFQIETCEGDYKLFSSLSTWQLMNLKLPDILDIPDRLYQEHGVSNKFLSKIMEKFTIQSTGKGVLEKEFELLDKPAQYFLSTTRHYSWPKSAAIAGLGSDNVIGIEVDDEARIDMKSLKRHLERSLKTQQPVLAVVAIIGSTEEGAVDPLSEILALRKQYQTRGLSFLVHADAAWGGYFCSMLPKNYVPGDVLNLPTEMGNNDGFVPDSCLRVQTQDDLFAIRFADSITVDPHKAGYIPYPAGGLCYRDGRSRFLVTWTSPYLSRGSVTSIGIYGVEGSKPGASAVSTWLSNKVIGLGQEGYGKLLGEVSWTCSRFSAEWASVSSQTTPFICVPLNKLPSEIAGESSAKVEAEKDWIRHKIIGKSNAQIVKSDAERHKGDRSVMELLRAIGSDLNINAFSLNFRDAEGKVNEDIEEANYLMQRVVKAFSVESPADDPTKIPFYLTSTEFSDELYKDCKADLMKRLGLKPSKQDLMVLRNVVMSPFPSDGGFIRKLVETFERKVEEETELVRLRNGVTQEFHKFLMQGTDEVFLIHLPMFHVANHRQQLIISIKLDHTSNRIYKRLKKSNPTEPMILVTQEKVKLQDMLNASKYGSFKAQIKTEASGIVLKGAEVTITGEVVSRPLNSGYRLDNYPENFMPFYLYGSADEANIDHVIVKAPNVQLSAGRCKLDITSGNMTSSDWNKPLLLIIHDLWEAPMQPFPPNDEIGTRHGAVIAHEHVEIPSEHRESTQSIKQESVGKVKLAQSGEQSGEAKDIMKSNSEIDSTESTLEQPEDAASNLNGTNKGSSDATLQLKNNGVNGTSDEPTIFGKGSAYITSEVRSGRMQGSKFFFRPGAQFQVSIWEESNRPGVWPKQGSGQANGHVLDDDEDDEDLDKPLTPEEIAAVEKRKEESLTAATACPGKGNREIGRGKLTLGASVYVDSEAMNHDPFAKESKVAEWRNELDQVGRNIEQETFMVATSASTAGTKFRKG